MRAIMGRVTSHPATSYLVTGKRGHVHVCICVCVCMLSAFCIDRALYVCICI